jgi:hypothetical protein
MYDRSKHRLSVNSEVVNPVASYGYLTLRADMVSSNECISLRMAFVVLDFDAGFSNPRFDNPSEVGARVVGQKTTAEVFLCAFKIMVCSFSAQQDRIRLQMT